MAIINTSMGQHKAGAAPAGKPSLAAKAKKPVAPSTPKPAPTPGQTQVVRVPEAPLGNYNRVKTKKPLRGNIGRMLREKLA